MWSARFFARLLIGQTQWLRIWCARFEVFLSESRNQLAQFFNLILLSVQEPAKKAGVRMVPFEMVS